MPLFTSNELPPRWSTPPSSPVMVPWLTMRMLLPVAWVTIPSLTPVMLPVFRITIGPVPRMSSASDSDFQLAGRGDEGACDAVHVDGVGGVGGDPGVLADVQQEDAAVVVHGPVGARQRSEDRDQRRIGRRDGGARDLKASARADKAELSAGQGLRGGEGVEKRETRHVVPLGVPEHPGRREPARVDFMPPPRGGSKAPLAKANSPGRERLSSYRERAPGRRCGRGAAS